MTPPMCGAGKELLAELRGRRALGRNSAATAVFSFSRIRRVRRRIRI